MGQQGNIAISQKIQILIYLFREVCRNESEKTGLSR